MAKATIQRDIHMNEGERKPSKFDPTKQTCPILVETENGNLYTMYATQGGKLWNMVVGDVIPEIEITEEPNRPGGRGMARLPKDQSGFKPYVRRGFVKPTNEEAAAAADYIVQIYAAVKGRAKDLTPEAIATLTAAIFAKTC